MKIMDIGLEVETLKEKDKIPLDPFNIKLLKLTEKHTQYMTPITVPDIIQPATKNLHPQGLYSTEIFGRVGSQERKKTFSYINLKVDVMQPVFFKYLIKARKFFEGVISGKVNAVWDDEKKTFREPEEGEEEFIDTGYHFFTSHLQELELPATGSVKRDVLIALKNQGGDKLLIDKLVVLPAGLRDVRLSDTGYPEDEDEVNSYYWGIFNLANGVNPGVYKNHPKSLDNLRYRIQIKINELYDYLFDVSIGGKKKFAMGKWAARNLDHGTRNVLTTLINNTTTLGGDTMVKPNETVVGLYQFLKATGPLSIHHIKNCEIVSTAFPGQDLPAKLVSQNTLQSRNVNLDISFYDKFTSKEGIEKLIKRYSMEELRHQPIIVKDCYLALIYKDQESFMILYDIRDLPDGLDASKVSPITLAEFLYISVYSRASGVPILVTRYPVGAEGGVYPSFCYLTTTVKTSRLKRRDTYTGTIIEGDVAKAFPINSLKFYDSFSPHTTHLARLGAD